MYFLPKQGDLTCFHFMYLCLHVLFHVSFFLSQRRTPSLLPNYINSRRKPGTAHSLLGHLLPCALESKFPTVWLTCRADQRDDPGETRGTQRVTDINGQKKKKQIRVISNVPN